MNKKILVILSLVCFFIFSEAGAVENAPKNPQNLPPLNNKANINAAPSYPLPALDNKTGASQYPLPSQTGTAEPQTEDLSSDTSQIAPEIESETDINSSDQKDFDIKKYSKIYKGVTKDGVVMQALEMMKGTIADYSYNAIMGNNLTKAKIYIKFRNLAEIKPEYESFDALGWKSKGRLYIYINSKHQDAPPEAIAAVLAHEAIHQDEFASLNEETYAWTLEAATWVQLTEDNDFATSSGSSLVEREEMLKKLFIKGNYTDKYIKKAVWSNPGYANMPSRSPGFEDDHL